MMQRFSLLKKQSYTVKMPKCNSKYKITTISRLQSNNVSHTLLLFIQTNPLLQCFNIFFMSCPISYNMLIHLKNISSVKMIEFSPNHKI